MRARWIAVAVVVCLGAPQAFGAVEFRATGAVDMVPSSVTDDGGVIVGSGVFGNPNLRYTEASGALVIGNGCVIGVGEVVISGDGSTVLGCKMDEARNFNAGMWLGKGNWDPLGTAPGAVPCGFDLSSSWGINDDGTIGVGLVWLADVCQARAGVWDLVNGGDAVVLEDMVPRSATRANAVSDDGSVIVGWQDAETGARQAAKWVDGAEELILNDLGRPNGEALAVSGDGTAIVGTSYDFQEGPAWIWREGIGMTAVGRPGGGSFTLTDVSDDGTMAVGFSSVNFFNNSAILWREGSDEGVPLARFLAERGAAPPAGWTLNVARRMTPDKRFIVGWGINPDGFVEMFVVDLHAR